MLWRRLDRAGHEHVEVRGTRLRGVALFTPDCRLEYEVECDASWATMTAAVWGVAEKRRIDVDIRVTDGQWFLNDELVPDVDGCIDVDLNFSPSTNLIPIRRLGLAVGDEATVRAAWLRFPSFALEPLEQTYRRLGEKTYRYSSAGGRFVAELEVDDDGLPRHYGEIWREEA